MVAIEFIEPSMTSTIFTWTNSGKLAPSNGWSLRDTFDRKSFKYKSLNGQNICISYCNFIQLIK